MILTDVNVLVYAHRTDVPDHEQFREWLRGVRETEEPFAFSDLVLSGFLRVVTHPGIFRKPTPLPVALSFVVEIRNAENAVPVSPGPRHWEIFEQLCRDTEARGALVPDAFLAALAIESGCEWVTTDRDFARFPGLRWRHPLKGLPR
jgi:toxin-antitoxin system PIN domain toxin